MNIKSGLNRYLETSQWATDSFICIGDIGKFVISRLLGRVKGRKK
ncbi:hypothetical protein DFQ12_1675 [Sphingobacterium detergens]|uniref:Uncharacterized protein n=1 Tax=Sphingobacterium detergens TaxID=1145106 RepID=A0A420BJP5_SPHD1|nr:hypothetical protein DFQ12_1675 [Sphingobacterium detergens]